MYTFWSKEEIEEYERIRITDERLDKIYEKGKISDEDPEMIPALRLAFLARCLTLAEEDYVRIEEETHGSRPLKLRRFEEMIVNNSAPYLK